ncbi:MAG: hypothetical protein M1831_003442 [Alyxoria varia]|nr:MAG: hypothetical protein M1831_003442 [Alyxoria varia]
MAATNQHKSSASKPNAKLKKDSKIVILQLTPSLFEQRLPPEERPSSKKPHTEPEPPKDKSQSVSVAPEAQADENATSTPNGQGEDNTTGQSDNSSKRKGVPGPKPGQKKSSPGVEQPNGDEHGNGNGNGAKPRGKPGPKRRKLDGEPNGIAKAGGAGTAAPSHKLGPKANQGAINAGLRALDRTGKPCRRWNKKGFNLKSFTGVAWSLPYWQTPGSRFSEGKSETTGSSEAKPDQTNSMVGSEKNNEGKDSNAGAPAPSAEPASSPPEKTVSEAAAVPTAS